MLLSGSESVRRLQPRQRHGDAGAAADGSTGESIHRAVLRPSRQYNALFGWSRSRGIAVFVRLNDLARERLRAHAGVAQRLDLLSHRIALLNHLALFRLGFIQQAAERAALVGALLCKLRVRGRLFVDLPLQLLHIALMRGAALDELGMEPLPLFFSVLQPRPQVLQVCAPLLEELFELVLRGEGALKRFDRRGRFVERPLDGEHLLARVGRVGRRSRGIGTGRCSERNDAHGSNPQVLYLFIVSPLMDYRGRPVGVYSAGWPSFLAANSAAWLADSQQHVR